MPSLALLVCFATISIVPGSTALQLETMVSITQSESARVSLSANSAGHDTVTADSEREQIINKAALARMVSMLDPIQRCLRANNSRSRCGVIGNCRTAPGIPIASSMAEAIVAPTAVMPLSPAPLMPSGLSGDV